MAEYHSHRDYQCHDCNMTFRTYNQLDKHKQKFCIGVGPRVPRIDVGSPDNDIYRPSSYDSVTITPPKGGDVVERLRKKLDRGTPSIAVSVSTSERAKRSTYPARQRLVREPDDWKELEKIYSRRSSSSSSSSSDSKEKKRTYHSAYTKDEGRYYKENKNLSDRAQNHGNQLAYIKSRNGELEAQKEEIRRRLQELAYRDFGEYDAWHTSRLVKDLREQEEKNAQTLNDLKTQLEGMTNRREDPNMYLQGQGTLVAEIIALRNTYLQGGGNDPIFLAQLAEMLAEAQVLEKNKDKSPKKRKKRKGEGVSGQLMAFELENQRLQRELLLLQEKSMKESVNKSQHSEQEKFEREMKRLQMEHLNRMQQLQQEMELTKHQMLLEKMKREMGEVSGRGSITDREPVQKQPQAGAIDTEPINGGQFDTGGGFLLFHDFVMGLEPYMKAVRLVVSLYRKAVNLGDPSILPQAYTESVQNQNQMMAYIGAKQPVPRCPPLPEMSLIIELQAGEASDGRMTTRAWSKLDLFDTSGQLLVGKYRLPFRVTPLKPEMNMYEFSTLPQFGNAEVYLRVVHRRDAERFAKAGISARYAHLYLDAGSQPAPPPQLNYQPNEPNAPQPTIPVYKPGISIPPPPSAPSIYLPNPREVPLLPPSRESEDLGLSLPPTPKTATTLIRESQDYSLLDSSMRGVLVQSDKAHTLGFQVIRVKKAESGEAKVRLTAYHSESGEIAQSQKHPVTCSTTAVRSTFKHGYHIFGHQEALFRGVKIDQPIALVARFYLRKLKSDEPDDDPILAENTNMLPDMKLDDNEVFTAWGTLPLVAPRNAGPIRTNRSGRSGDLWVNTGTHVIQLYKPPVPVAGHIPVDSHYVPKDWTRYGKATLRIHVFYGEPRTRSATPSEASDNEDKPDDLPPYTWLPNARRMPLMEHFTPTDGFDLYIDSCRFLPDSVTITRVAARVLTRKYNMVGRDVSCICKTKSSTYHPIFDHRQEFRDPGIPPTSTLVIKVYTIDRFTQKLTVAGHALLNIFVETGTEKQPQIDEGGQQISLNEGGHQLRLYHYGPNGTDPLTEEMLYNNRTRMIPCASICVRLIRAPLDQKGATLSTERIPQADWGRYGLVQPMPQYSNNEYHTMKCTPTEGEIKLYQAMVKRPKISITEAVQNLTKKRFLQDSKVEQYCRNQLVRSMDDKPEDHDMTFICQYDPKAGIKVSIDTAMNLPWSNFTHAHFCLNPPGAFYMGPPNAAYDKLKFTHTIDLNSQNNAPMWKDGFHHFPGRAYHRYLTLIIHLQEIKTTMDKDNYRYGLIEQAWTAVQIFNQKYANTYVYQLPLFHGSPTKSMLKQLARESCGEFLDRHVQSGILKVVNSASVFVRVCDARRDDELTQKTEDDVLELNTEYIPNALYRKYSQVIPGQPLSTLVPPGKSPGEFVQDLAATFKNLVYKLYEEGNMNT